MHSREHEEKDILLRVYIGENDHHQGRPLYEVIVKKARELGLAGATVQRGIMGFGADSRLKSAHILDLSNDMPIIIEIVDTPDQIDAILPFLDEVVTEGLVTMETIQVIKYRNHRGTGTKLAKKEE